MDKKENPAVVQSVERTFMIIEELGRMPGGDVYKRQSLGGFLLLLYGLRLLITWAGVCLLMGVSSRCKSVVASLILG